MKRIIFSIFIFLISFFFFSVTSVSAKILTSKTGSINVPKTQTINDDLLVTAQNVTIDGTVNGNVFIAAQSVKIGGIINGSLHIASQSVDLAGRVKESVYIMAQQIMVDSNIEGSLISASQNLEIGKNSIIGGSLISAAANLNVDGNISKNIYAAASMLSIGPDAKIGKNVYYASDQNITATIDKSAKIGGQVVKSVVKTAQPATAQIEKKAPAIIGAGILAFNLISFIAALFVGLLYINVFGRNFAVVRSVIQRYFWKSLGVGFLTTIAYGPVMFILLLTIIGIPIAVIATLILLIFGYLAKIVVGAALGSWMAVKAQWKMSAFWSFALGLLIIYILKIIPVLGLLTDIVVVWIGLGALLLHLFSRTE